MDIIIHTAALPKRNETKRNGSLKSVQRLFYTTSCFMTLLREPTSPPRTPRALHEADLKTFGRGRRFSPLLSVALDSLIDLSRHVKRRDPSGAEVTSHPHLQGPTTMPQLSSDRSDQRTLPHAPSLTASCGRWILPARTP